MTLKIRPLAGPLVAAFLLLAVVCAARPSQAMVRVDSLALIGEIRLELGDAKHALDPLEEAVKADPALATARHLLGKAYLGVEKWKDAEKAFQAALELDAGLAGAHNGLGLIDLYDRNDAAAARAHFETALERSPGSVEIRTHLGMARLLAKNRNLRRAAERALRQDAMDAAACRVLAEHHVSKDEWDRAIEFFVRYLDLEPGDEDAAYRLALLYLEAGRYDDLREMLVRLGDRSGQRRWLPLVAQLYLHEGDGGQAMEVFEDYIGRLDAGEVGLYRDISLAASRSEMEALARLSGTEREAFVERFWVRHDLSLVTGGALRRAEHCRRVWYARSHFARAIYPWDRRGEVYIRYGEPDYRATSKKLNADIPHQVQRIKERMAVELYGPDAVGEFYTGPVYPVRSNRSFSTMKPAEEMGLNWDEVRLLMGFEDLPGAELATQLEEEAARGGGRETRESQDEVQSRGAAGADISETSIDISRVRHEKFVEQTTGLYMPVTSLEDASVVPWESWVYTMVAEGFEVTFTDEYFKGNYDFAPVPTHVPNELRERYVEVRDMADFLWHAPELVAQKMAGRVPDFHDFARGTEPLDFWYRTASFRGEDGRTRLEVYFGIPPDSLMGREEGVWVEQSAALVDPRVDQVYRSNRELFLGESFLLASADTGRGWQNLVLDVAALEAPSGVYEFGIQVRERSSRRFQLYKQRVVLEDYTKTDLLLSDIELAWSISEAEDGDEGAFVKHGLEVMPMSVWTFPKGHPAFLYFEIYNLARNEFGQTRYRVTYEVRSRDAAGGAAKVLSKLGQVVGTEQEAERVSVTYDQVGREAQDISYVELSLDEAGVGDQEVRVTVTDLVSEQSVSKKTTFGIR